MKKYDLIFITTFINQAAVRSLLESTAHNRGMDLCVVLVAQNGLGMDLSPYRTQWTDFYQIVVPGQLNSSQGRNVGIDYVLEKGIESNFVMFPDDDSSFDEVFFRSFKDTADSRYCYVTNVRGEGVPDYFMRINAKEDQVFGSTHWNKIGAVNMILNYSIFLKTGRFDELMGVGAKYGGGEDADYYLRSLRQGAMYRHVRNLYSYHPVGTDRYRSMSYRNILKRFKKYGEGVVYMLCKHKMYGCAVRVCARGLGGSVVSLFRLDFKMSGVYLYAFWCRTRLFTRILLGYCRKDLEVQK